MNTLVTNIENEFLKFIPNCKILSAPINPLGDEKHTLGLYTLHYIKDVYVNQALKIKNVLNN